MPFIKYMGHTPVVSVPTYGIQDVDRNVQIEVAQGIFDDLTAGGLSTDWVEVV